MTTCQNFNFWITSLWLLIINFEKGTQNETVVVSSNRMEDNNDGVINKIEADYTRLASEIEMNKNNLLVFLNQSHIRNQYKTMYENILQQLEYDINENAEARSSDSIVSTRRIVSGRNTSIAAVPWQASLRERTFPICGGSIVTHMWIITAAHCLIRGRPADMTIRVGSSWKTHGGEMFDVKATFVHPHYVSRSKQNDVGLVKLYVALHFSSTIMPISLTHKGVKIKGNAPAIISGWGKLKEGGPSTTYLQSTHIKTIPMKACRHSGLDKHSIRPESMFCAGSFKQSAPDACQGDSGGPIVMEGVLVGVVSWGLGCARGNFPGVYTRLANPIISDWVHDQIKKVHVYNNNWN